MSRFSKGDVVVDQHGERFIVVEEPCRCTVANEWTYVLVPDSAFSVARFESELNHFSKGSPDQQAFFHMFQVSDQAAPAPPVIGTGFMTAADALMEEE